MASMHRRYRRNSPAAVARVVAAFVIGDRRIDPRELDFMDRVGVFAILGVERELFMRVAAELAGEMRLDARPGLGRSPARMARFLASLEAIEDRDLQHVVSAVLVYLGEADHSLDPDEVAMVRQALRRWNVSVESLERELNVPRHRTEPYFAAAQPAGA